MTDQLTSTTSLQTWEYSPVYSLRSYSYILFTSCLVWSAQFCHSIVFKRIAYLRLLTLTVPIHVQVFFITRAFLSLLAVLVELTFAKSVSKVFGGDVGVLYLLVNLISPGPFLACNQLLPSSSFMLFSLLSFSAFFNGSYSNSILWSVASVVCCWPFAGVIYIPLFISLCVCFGLRNTLRNGLRSLAFILLPVISIDFGFYGKPVVACMNIITYNLGVGRSNSSRGGKSHLYGVEPWSFYLKNLALNFNVFTVFSLIGVCVMINRSLFIRKDKKCSNNSSSNSGVASTDSCKFREYLRTLQQQQHHQNTHSAASPPGLRACMFVVGTPFPVFIILMNLQKHKEERFLTPVYPLICLSSAIAFSWIMSSSSSASISTTGKYSSSSVLSNALSESLSGSEFATEFSPAATNQQTRKIESSIHRRFLPPACVSVASHPPNTTTTTRKQDIQQDIQHQLNNELQPQTLQHPKSLKINVSNSRNVFRTTRQQKSFLPILPSNMFALKICLPLLWCATALLGVLRVLALYFYYWKPVIIIWITASNVHNQQDQDIRHTDTAPAVPDNYWSIPEINMCTGSEWFRYPSSFFLPVGGQLKFLSSGFKGLLPGIFSTTREIPTFMNDDNQEEIAKYSPITACDYLIDSTDPLQETSSYFDHHNDSNPIPRRSLLDLNQVAPVFTSSTSRNSRNNSSRSNSSSSSVLLEINGGIHLRRLDVIRCVPLLDATRSAFPYRSFFMTDRLLRNRRGLVFSQFCLWRLTEVG